MTRERDEEQMRAIFGTRRRRLRSATVRREERVEREPPPGLRAGRMGWLDRDAEQAWVETLNARERETWDKLVELLDNAGPEMRWRVAGRVMRTELDHARKVYRVASNVTREGYKAELVKQQGQRFRGAVEALEERIAPLYDVLVPFRHLIEDVERAYRMVTGNHQTLSRVTGPWNDSWPGAAKGRGITGYDTPEGVARVQREVREAHERYLREQEAKGEKRRSRGRRRSRSKFGNDDPGQGSIV